VQRHRFRQAGIITTLAGLALTVASPAFAHVTAHTDEPIRGASDAAVMFRTPNEESKAACVKLQVFFPTGTPLLDVLVQPHPGWTSIARSTRLPRPVTTDDGKITQAVSEVTWTAKSTAAGLQPGQADDFIVIAGQLPDAPSVTFRALQTYSNGDVVKWIETQAPGADEPEHPAPVLELVKAGSSDTSTSANFQSGSQSMAGMPGMTMTGTPVTTTSGFSSDKLAVSLIIAIVILAVIALALAVTWRRPRD
jgi:uncharacterized protein YcnI